MAEQIENDATLTEAHSTYKPADASSETGRHPLTGMYRNWFLDYASYVILERAVPHSDDGSFENHIRSIIKKPVAIHPRQWVAAGFVACICGFISRMGFR